ncbi:antibiotic biosynthesis monooxygenase [Streptomyces sp. SID8379]|uniref:antibiotic biosynthesis monooxygenase family protein n=1 Tax=unclassified Streptomyces TaxID=2593676 RepID=UPI000475C132|nr:MULTISPECIES: antibiotic biosynthesis monooxygenase [unclassified Streptomyces]MYW63877.1 antibiotic biosynthesis monooxygenase [Streptomyces sp. SID8379]
MSDHAEAPVAPLPAFELRYYVVVFSSARTEEDRGYGETAYLMHELVREIPGYLGHESAGTPGGLGITVGYFRDVAAIEQWRSRGEHRDAQKQGRAEWYERYTVHVAKVERSHGFVRE